MLLPYCAFTLSPSPPTLPHLHSRPHFLKDHLLLLLYYLLHARSSMHLYGFTSTSTSPPAGSTSCTSTSTFYHPPTPCPWQVRTLPDANMLWRHQLVESDIRQHYRNPEMPSSPPIK